MLQPAGVVVVFQTLHRVGEGKRHVHLDLIVRLVRTVAAGGRTAAEMHRRQGFVPHQLIGVVGDAVLIEVFKLFGLAAGLIGKDQRNAIVDNIEEFRAIIDAPDMKRYYPGWISESLKSAPKGWPKDHPDIDLLRLKDYGKFCRCDEKFFDTPDWPAKVAERFRILKPMVDFLNYSIDEEI